MSRKLEAVTAGLIVCCSVAAISKAHDLWIVPGAFRLGPGESVRVFLNSGDAFPGSDSLLGEYRVLRCDLITGSEKTPITRWRVDGKSLTAEIGVSEEGSAVLALAIKPRLVRLKADEFNEYLKEDGLPHILAERERRDELDESVVERYTKWAKAILKVGEKADDTWRRTTGLRMEILPEKCPYSLEPGEELPVRVVFEGKGVGGLTVMGGRAGGPRHEIRAVTDSEGRARLILPEPGRWYMHAIHMIRLEDDPQIQWESFWTTLTFEVSP